MELLQSALQVASNNNTLFPKLNQCANRNFYHHKNKYQCKTTALVVNILFNNKLQRTAFPITFLEFLYKKYWEMSAKGFYLLWYPIAHKTFSLSHHNIIIFIISVSIEHSYGYIFLNYSRNRFPGRASKIYQHACSFMQQWTSFS